MKISIFPKALSHPKTKEEKSFNAKFTSSPYPPEIVEINTEDELISLVTSKAWSPALFKNFRRKEDFLSTDFMVLDIDQGLTITEAETRCRKLGKCFLILPTANHTPQQNRFRLIFPLVKTVRTMRQYSATWENLSTIFPELDKQCSDCCRFYFGSNMSDGVFCDGPMLEPVEIIDRTYDIVIKEWKIVDKEFYKGKNLLEVIYDEVPERIPDCVDFFLRNASEGIPGGWICALNAFVFTLALMGVEDDTIVTLVENLAPAPLDRKDTDQINRSLKDGKKAKVLREVDEYGPDGPDGFDLERRDVISEMEGT